MGIQVQNNSSLTMDVIRYSSCAASAYGDDVLATVIGPGQGYVFAVDLPGCYDVYVELQNNVGGRSRLDFNGVNVPQGQTATVTVVNP